MKWRIVDKTTAKIPTTGIYNQWKPQLAKEAGSQCVYCCISESKFGGIRNFHVEHYKPKSLFPALTNVYGNLFYACGVCNIFKSDDWPSEHQAGRYDIAAYPDPSVVDYSIFLHVDEISGRVSSDTFTGKYIIERLHLNRPQMIGLRAVTALFARIDVTIKDIRKLWDAGKIADEDKAVVTELLFSLYEVSRKFSEAKPYGSDQLK